MCIQGSFHKGKDLQEEKKEGGKSDCKWLRDSKDPCQNAVLYRTINGRCNNLEAVNVGRAGTPYTRLLMPEYKNGSKKNITMFLCGKDIIVFTTQVL